MITQIKKFYYDSIDSTNEESKRLIDSEKIKGISVIVADEQTKGKGTRGRTWISPKDAGIYLSIVHVNLKHCPEIELCTKSAAVACVEAIKEVCGVETKIKPINDIYAEGRKLGGILIETRLNKNEINALITGIGINTLVARRGAIDHALSIEELMKENFKNFSKEKLIEKIIEKVCFWHNALFNGKSNEIQSKYESLI